MEYEDEFPISRDPPEGGTQEAIDAVLRGDAVEFPISRDPPEGGTNPQAFALRIRSFAVSNF